MFSRRDGGNGTLLTARSVVEGSLLVWLLLLPLVTVVDVFVGADVEADEACVLAAAELDALSLWDDEEDAAGAFADV